MKIIQVKKVILKRQAVKREHQKKSQLNQKIKEGQAKVQKVQEKGKKEVMILQRIIKSLKPLSMMEKDLMEMTQMMKN